MKKGTLLAISAFSLILLLAAACGGSEPTPTATRAATPTATVVPLTGEPTLPPSSPACDDAATLGVSSVGEEQKFDAGELSACEGTQVTLKFNNASTTLQHNWVLVNSGTKDDVATRGTLFATADWVDPNDPDIVNNIRTALLNPGEVEEISFTAPSAGTYQFVCTFPGHNVTMFGDFVVTPGGTVAAPTTAASASPTATPAPTATSAPAGPIALEVSSVGEEQKFDKDTLTAPQGAQVTLKFNNVSTTLQHNWVLVKAGTKNDVAARGTFFPTGDWVDPSDPDIVDKVHTKLLATGGLEEISFTAPSAGTYQFVCTFPGHNVTMFGDFVVSK